MAGFSTVDPGYRHIAKSATPGPSLNVGSVELKWYDLASEDGVPDEVRASGRTHVTAALTDGSMAVHHEAGFVILHRCGEDFYFLLTSIWRGTNELWESVRYRDGPMADFAAFDPAYPPAGKVRPTFCVWELGVVAHEARAWSMYLRSPRGEADKEAWRRSRFQGPV